MTAASIEAVLSRRFHLTKAPTLATHVSGAPVAFSRLTCLRAGHERAGPVPPEDSFALQVMLRPLASWDLSTRGGLARLPAASPGDVFLFDLSENPRVKLNGAFDMMRFYLPRATLENFAAEDGWRRASGLRAPATGVHDPVLHGLALSLAASMTQPGGAQALFVDHVALAFQAHATATYTDGAPGPTRRTGLAPWQFQRARDAMESALDAPHSIGELAQACGLSGSHFARAFKRTTGLAPHQWLTRRRVERARTLLSTTSMGLADIALACGFVDQSHFSRVFARLERLSPGQWRRERAS